MSKGTTGSLLIIGGAEDRCCGSGALEKFVELAGGKPAHIVLITTATVMPDEVHAEYEAVFGRLGVTSVRELRLICRADADDEATLAVLQKATGVLLSGGDQSRIRTLVGSRTNDLLRARLSEGDLVAAGTSAGATALGRTMILSGRGHEVAASSVRIGQGLGLLSGVLIDMHFAERGRLSRLLSAIALEPEYLGLGIDEDTAVLVEGGRFEVLGSGVVTVIDANGATVAYAASDDAPITLFDVRLHMLPVGCFFDIEARRASIGRR